MWITKRDRWGREPTRPGNEADAGGENQAQAGQGQQPQQPAHQRQVVVRRFDIAFQVDIFLILKLAAVIFLFNQDGSRQRLASLGDSFKPGAMITTKQRSIMLSGFS
ncbi:hypothetical protein Bca4012_066464 [Brassica carinata]|uniref:Uncharacterized protein n=1 Tax=Brassica carinata TaxID=52824 RepID=A0A8X7VR38_BRACI|nr:hypothetical protein Bca52824_018769 [Brassica carinata]